MLEDQKNNDNIRVNIEDLEGKIKGIQHGLGTLGELKGELNNYVAE